MTVIYVIVKYLTIVGTFTKAFFEHLSCRVYEVLIEDGRYLARSEMCGHIEHEFIKKRGVCFGVCFFPFLFNLMLGLMFLSAGAMNILYIGEFYMKSGVANFPSYIYLWIGISMLTNLFPQWEDALTLKELIYSKDSNMFIKIIAAPIFAILYVGAALERTGITLITSCGFAFVLVEFYKVLLPAIL